MCYTVTVESWLETSIYLDIIFNEKEKWRTFTMKNQMQVLFGTVNRVKPRRNFWEGGYSVFILDGATKQLTASDHNGPFKVGAEDGMSTPEFTREKFSRTPLQGERLAVQVNEAGKVVCWSFEDEWKAAEIRLINLARTRRARSYQLLRKLRTGVAAHLCKEVLDEVQLPDMVERIKEKKFRTVLASTACVA